MHPPAPRGRQPGRPRGRAGGASPPHGGLPRGALGRGVSLEGRGRAWGSSVTGTLWGLLGGTHSCRQAGRSEGLHLPSCLPPPSDPQPRVHGGSGTHRPGSHTGPPSSGFCPGSLIGKTSDRPESAPRGASGSQRVSQPAHVASQPLVKCVFGSHGRVAGAALVGSLTGHCRGAEPPGRRCQRPAFAPSGESRLCTFCQPVRLSAAAGQCVVTPLLCGEQGGRL